MSELAAEIKSYGKRLEYEPVPLVERGWEIIKQWNPKPLKSFEGVDLTEFTKRIEKPLMTFRMEHFYTDKAEKINLGWYFYMPVAPRMTQTFVVCPSDNYDLPMFISDLDQRAKGSSLIVDLWPTVDLVAEEWYREKYFDGIAPIYSKYWDFEKEKIVFHVDLSWWRSFSSPYEINTELPNEQRDTLAQMFTDYLKYYADLYKKAKPITDPKIKEHVVKKKRVFRKWFRERDPAKGVMIRALGAEMEKKIMVGLL